MNSSTSRTLEKRREQEEIKRQIKLLKAQLDEPEHPLDPGLVLEYNGAGTAGVPHENRDDDDIGGGKEVTLAPNTPSPRKKRKLSHPPSGPTIPRPSFHHHRRRTHHPIAKAPSTKPSAEGTNVPIATQPSTLFSSLRRLEEASACAEDDEGKGQVERTVGFEEKPRVGHTRDERLALVEDFSMGPYEFTPPVGDPTFDAFEPHSGIALSSRKLPHVDLADYLFGRFYISPSRLYSLLRLDTASTNTHKNGQKAGYDLDVPVPGDWVTIAVIAERGPIRYTKAPVGVEKDEEDGKAKKRWDGSGKKEKPALAEQEGGGGARGGKKYVTLKMVDFGARSQSSGGQIRGDGILNLILFEADGYDVITQGARRKGRGEEKVYRGGSGGAFEKLMDVREGDVVALLNPRVLKPFQRTNSSQVPILAVTPPSASSILIIGRSRDLGMCTVLKADGKVCGAWCDKRAVVGSSREEDKEKGSVCEFHLERAVMRRRAGRNEFAIGTSGMSTSATHKRKHDYDPLRKWGLKPNDSGSGAGGGGGSGSGTAGLGATYVFAGHVVSNHNVAAVSSSAMFVNEKMGREAQARARRKMGDGKVKEGEEELVSRLVGKGRGKREKGRSREVLAKGKGKAREEEEEDESGSEGKAAKDIKERRSKPLYSAEFIKSVGFDPSLKAGIVNGPGGGSGISKSVQDKLDALEALQRSRVKAAIELGPRRGGPRIRSGVVVPPCATGGGGGEVDVGGKENGVSEGERKDGDGDGKEMIDLDDSSDGDDV